MWSLYERKTTEDSSDGANLFNYSGEKLEPLKFSNGKTQADVVKEVLNAINTGNKIIFIKGICGTGKSAVALNLARHFKKTSIIVPIKSLQEQYEKDYTQKKFITKKDGNPLKIAVIKGRNNFRCPFSGERADDPELPCTIEIRDKNTEQLLKYIDMNDAVEKEDFSSASDIRRMNIAPACPYWAPLMPSEINPKGLTSVNKKRYPAICGKEFALFSRKKGCGYYDQYKSYSDADVLIFNSMKYQIESSMGRKPKTDIEIIDECDEFLDSFANERKINLNRLHSALLNLMPTDREERTKVKELIKEINDILFNPPKIEVQKIKLSPLISLIETILENPNLAEDEELNYYNTVVETARTFENLLDETYISIAKIEKEAKQKGLFAPNTKGYTERCAPNTKGYLLAGSRLVRGSRAPKGYDLKGYTEQWGNNFSNEDTIILNLVSINLTQKLQELIEQNNVLIMMSGTLHSEQVLKDIFGLKKFKIIEAETESPGKIHKQRTGLEKNCSFANFSDKNITRKMYLKILDMCMANAEQPTLVHVSAFKDLPTEEENAEYKFENLITQEKLKELQSRGNTSVDEFASGREDILFTTKCSRGVDFAGDKCNSIVITKFPYPNIQGLFWKILKQEQPEKFMEFYMDKAQRDLFQKVSRGVRFKGDKVSLWSPDVRVINARLD